MNQTPVSDPVRPSPKPGLPGFPPQLPMGSYLTLKTFLGLLSSSPWRTSVPAPRSHHRQDHVVCCPLCAQWTGQEQGQSGPAGDPRAQSRALGWESRRLVPPAHCGLLVNLGQPRPSPSLTVPTTSVEGGTECFHSAFQLKTSPTFYLANGDADGDKNRCGKRFEKFIAGSPGREAFLLWGGRRGRCGQSRG